MKTGDVILDGQKNRYQVGVLLGRGLWGKSYRVRREADQGDYVLKCPLCIEDLPADFPRSLEVEKVCRAILAEQVELLRQEAYTFLPRLVEHFTTADGEPVLVIKRFPASLEQRLLAGAPFSELVGVITQAVRWCHQLADGPGFHGALRPTNIMLDEKGQVLLTDVATPSQRRELALLLAVARPGFHYLPPEIADARGAPPFAPVADSYAAGFMLWRATMGAGEALPLPREGLDKSAKVNLKDRLRARLAEEDSNPRFQGILADRLSKVVDRAISVNTTPSPPYRFRRLDELLPRVDELRALVRPRVESVGRIVLNRGPGEVSFTTDENIKFTASVDCSAGVDKHDEIGCGIAVFDRETGARLREVPSGYGVEPYPSGRFRFSFDIEPLVPGSYLVRLAFAIRDSGHEPVTKEVEFEVRAAPGYLPPREEPPPEPLPLHKAPDAAVAPTSPPGVAVRPAPQVEVDDSDTVKVALADLAPPLSSGPTAVEAPDRPAIRVAPPESLPPRDDPGQRPRPVPAPQAAPSAPSVAIQPPSSPATQRNIPIVDPRPAPRKVEPELPPSMTVGGSWTDLPLPGPGDDDLVDLEEVDEDPLRRFRPTAPWWTKTVQMIRGDAYVMFMAGAAVLIFILVVALLLLKG